MYGLSSFLWRGLLLALVAAIFTTLCFREEARADITVTDPSLPPLTGHWSQTSDSDFARYAGNLVANGTAVTLTGGMDASYNPTAGYATVKSLTVGTGSVVIGNITIR
jgi:hypothetical protein